MYMPNYELSATASDLTTGRLFLIFYDFSNNKYNMSSFHTLKAYSLYSKL